MRNRRKEHPPWFAELKVIREDDGQVPNTIAEEFTTQNRSDDQQRNQRKQYDLVER